MGAFEEAVLAWRTSRDPRDAAAAEAIAAAEPERPALPASGKAKDVAIWNAVEREGDWRDFPRLHATMTAGKSPLALERVPVLAKRDDPRFVPGLIATLERPPYTAGTSKKFWQAVVSALAETRDVRARDGMELLSKRYKLINDTHLGAWLAGAMSKAAAGMEVAWEEAKTKAKPGRLDELLARVIAAPDDDDARLVYADAASEAGDRRGELIVLQVERAAGRGSPERSDLEREKFLGAEKELALALAPAANKIELERGFPAKVELANSGIDLVIDAPEWGTVHTLTRAAVGPVAPLLRFLDGERLPNLVTVESIKAKWIDKLRQPTFPWKRVSIINDNGLKPFHLTRFPQLRELSLHGIGRLNGELFAAAPLLESVTLDELTRWDNGAVFGHHPALRRLALRLWTTPERFAGAPVRELAVRTMDIAAADAWLRAVPTVTSLEIEIDKPDWAATAALFDAHPKLESLMLDRVRGDVLLTRTPKGLTLTALPGPRWEAFYPELVSAAPVLRSGGVSSFVLFPEGPRHRIRPLHEDLVAMLRTAWPDLEHRELL